MGMIFHSLASLQDNYVAERPSPDITEENNISFEPHHFGGQQSSETQPPGRSATTTESTSQIMNAMANRLLAEVGPSRRIAFSDPRRNRRNRPYRWVEN